MGVERFLYFIDGFVYGFVFYYYFEDYFEDFVYFVGDINDVFF